MTAIFQIKRRFTGTAGRPANLLPGEIAYDGVGQIFYIGDGEAATPGGFAPKVSVMLDLNHLSSLASREELATAIAGVSFATSAGLTFANNELSLSDDVADKSYVDAKFTQALAQLVDGAPEKADTIREIFEMAENNKDGFALLNSAIGNKMDKAANLADLADKPAARSNLGLSSMAEQSADNVDISGGVISGVVLDGGTF